MAPKGAIFFGGYGWRAGSGRRRARERPEPVPRSGNRVRSQPRASYGTGRQYFEVPVDSGLQPSPCGRQSTAPIPSYSPFAALRSNGGAQVAVGEGRESDRSRFRAAETACAASRVQAMGRGRQFILARILRPKIPLTFYQPEIARQGAQRPASNSMAQPKPLFRRSRAVHLPLTAGSAP